ncbi:hypothetical protein [Yersinia intermedia]|uniref:hypothetical protein n=1 Tax=Yersinia intermedia TaxID=631 RepID=UPI001F53E015|nr:hypothetical protein [Yersinia intermedia]UNK25121.1 hypothetical protein MNQ97_09225 [Yersinia intermedia]
MMDKSILQQINHWAACARLTSECSSVVHADLLEKVASHIISIESLQEETQKERDDAQRDRDLHYRVSEKFRIELIASEAALSAANDKLSKPIVLPAGFSVRAGHPINEGERNVMIPKEGGNWLSRFDVEHAIHVAGFTVEGE